MKKFQPLLLQKINLRMSGVHIRQVALHRHLPETTTIRPHAHKFAQCLLFLTGQGKQQIAGAFHIVQVGTSIFLPPHVEHAFHRAANRQPICLVIDFDWRGSSVRPPYITRMPFSMLSTTRQLLAKLAILQKQKQSNPPLQIGALLLELLNLLLHDVTKRSVESAASVSPILRKVENLLASQDSAGIPLRELSRRAGYQHDYLNRQLKRCVGMSLGQLRARKRALSAQRLLNETKTVTAVASALGFSDLNYFSRWFRKAHGISPSQWRRNIRS